MGEQELIVIMGYGSVTTVSTSYNEGPEEDTTISTSYNEGPEEDPASDWDKNVELYARDAETGEWERI